MNCNIIYQDGVYICTNCGRTVKYPNFQRKCRKKVEKIEGNIEPGILAKVVHFTKAVTNHVVAGSPKCTQEEIDKRYEICKGCELFKNNTCTHSSCGCQVTDSQIFRNKLAWADQECPLGKWKRTDNQEKSV